MSDFVAVRPAYIGIKADGSQHVIADDDGQPIAPSWNADDTALVDGSGTEHEIIRSPVKVLYASQAPIILPPSGTIGSNGTLTISGDNPFAYYYTSGAWMYFPANAVYSSSPAGFYWVIMSSPTAGVVYANYATGSTDGTAYPPTAATPLSGTTGAEYTGYASTTTELRALTLHLNQVLVPGDSITVEMPVQFTNATITNGVNNKQVSVRGANDANYLFSRPWTSGASQFGVWWTKTIQIDRAGHTVRPEGWQNTDPNFNCLGSAELSLTDPVMKFDLLKAAATDWIAINYLRITHYAAAP